MGGGCSLLLKKAFPSTDKQEKAMDEEEILYYTGGCVKKNERITQVVVQDGVREIDDEAFKGCKKIRSITIPDSVTSIGKGAFRGLEKLEAISIPESVKTIGEWAFAYCKLLKAVVIPEGVTEIKEGTFIGCYSLESISFPKSLTKIARAAFAHCLSLKKIVIPEGVTVIEHESFFNCHSLKSITFPKSLTKIGQGAFEDCRAIEQLEIPNGVEVIGDSAFSKCTSLQSICIPNGITIVQKAVFEGCTSLHTVTLPPTIEEIGNNAFPRCDARCGDLLKFIIPDGLPALKDGFNPCSTDLISLKLINPIRGLNSTRYTPTKSYELAKQILENASSLTRMSLRRCCGAHIDFQDRDLPQILELISTCPTLREVDLSNNILSVGVFEKLASQDIPSQLRLLEIKDQWLKWENKERREWEEASSSPEHLLRILERNPKLVIETEKFWHDSEDQKVRHHLDMNEYGCRGFTLRESRWPELIETLALLEKEEKLRTGPSNILYHLLHDQMMGVVGFQSS